MFPIYYKNVSNNKQNRFKIAQIFAYSGNFVQWVNITLVQSPLLRVVAHRAYGFKHKRK
jgi:hypothetical protein